METYNSDYGRLNHPDDLAKYASVGTFKDFLADKSSPLVYCTLTVEGKSFLEKSHFDLTLDQKTNEHDTFTIATRADSLDNQEAYIMENSKSYLGKTIHIHLHRFGEIKQTFTGIITHLNLLKKNGYSQLYITGHAPTIMLEQGLECQSFENKTLEQIVQEITAEYPKDNFNLITKNSNTQHVIPYTVQYNQTDYQFLKQLAIRYGEYLYYDGQSLVLGNKVGSKIIVLEENIDLIHVSFELSVKPQQFTYTTYYTESGDNLQRDSAFAQLQSKFNPYQLAALKASKDVFHKKPNKLYNQTGISSKTDQELQDAVRKQKELRESLMVVKGKSKDPQLKQGDLTKLIDINDKPMETYRIIEIKHFHDGNQYYNEFVAIPDLWTPPYFDDSAYPNCEEQTARVVDNNDPMGMGRVRVQFPWQERKNQKTPWIRLIQPHSGAGKGFHFIPEIGEEVLVGFESGNAEKPFVLGTHYNGAATSGYHTSGNDVKAIHTRSGTKIILNDAQGSVFIEDPSGNTWTMDGHGNINVNAPKNMIFTAGEDMIINVGKNMTTSVGMNISESAGMNKNETIGAMKNTTVAMDMMTMVTGKLTEVIEGDVHSETKSGKTSVSSGKGMDLISTKNLNKHSDQEVQINSTEKSKQH
ncbi:type VI secretion system tip protein VgrG [Flavobacterium columnare]|uniref:Type VI secretion system tip protein VgrG n=1 Tax=Flavobacterium columnare TaxID=996 RepID=A0A437UCQ4_9FLAO|nr:type VI secretion system tip protein VgrG [Flavobacterium columnare]RVU91375.1 type VI secretion system tip protein VgrG [Flavobacterium columnare]